MSATRFTILGDRRFWLLLAFAAAMMGFPRAILTEWITQTGNFANTTHPGGADFVNFWLAGQMALKGLARDLYDPALYAAALTERYGTDFDFRWLYPPHFLLLAWPLGFLSYWTAFALFEGMTLLLFLTVAARIWGGREIALWLLLAPVTALGILVGQTAFLVGALMIGTIFWRDERPVLAGIFLGLLTIKPQFGVLMPLFFLLERRFLMLAVACATAAFLIGLSALVFGIGTWEKYLAHFLGPQSDVMHAGGSFLTMQLSAYGAARLSGAGVETAGLAQAASGAIALVVALLAARSSARADTKGAILIAATYLVTPYVLYYDLAAPSFAALWLYFGRKRASAPGPLFSLVLIATMGLSFVNALAVALGFGAGPIVFAALLAFLAARAFREARAEDGAGTVEGRRPQAAGAAHAAIGPGRPASAVNPGFNL